MLSEKTGQIYGKSFITVKKMQKYNPLVVKDQAIEPLTAAWKCRFQGGAEKNRRDKTAPADSEMVTKAKNDHYRTISRYCFSCRLSASSSCKI